MVHTIVGPTLLNASLWPCLKIPVKEKSLLSSKRGNKKDSSLKEIVDNHDPKEGVKGGFLYEDMVDIGGEQELKEDILAHKGVTESGGVTDILPEVDRFDEEWIVSKKKGEK